jgi:hypothetical protein
MDILVTAARLLDYLLSDRAWEIEIGKLKTLAVPIFAVSGLPLRFRQ